MSPLGINLLPQNGQENLTDYINQQYTNGAEIGDYIFLRFNSSISNETNQAYYQISSADSPTSTNRPLLKIITDFSTSVTPVKIQDGIVIINNPTENNILSMNIKGFSNDIEVLIHNSAGVLVLKNKYKINGDTDRLDIYNQKLSNGIFFVTILGNNKYAEAKFAAF